MKNDLIERYIYAVTKRLPQKVRKDISNELRTLIDDMLAERCGELVPEEKDIRVVLTELGTPEELYEKYNPDNKKCLIGSPYYSTYKYVLKIVMICTIFGVILANIISGILDFSKSNSIENVVSSSANFIASLITNLIISVGAAFGFVTALFAFFYHKDIKIDTTSNLDSLPSVPEKNEKISKVDSIISIGLSVIFLIVFLTAPQIFCVVMYNEFIPIFNFETIRQTWYIIVMFSVVGIIRDVVRLIEGRYSKKVMITTVAANIISGFLSLWWLMNDRIMNPKFADNISKIFNNESTFIINIFSNFQYFFLGLIIFALLLDILVTVFKYLKNKEK
ncbi:HAAS signaling domain-containing protein [Candidatus Pseudoruminococcus sp.]|uniref:HAAS signaling domain-containing protein n=1 Tax=Candidatus Pseudoruminococcus sp. TaxID=3101048 RepID=UPI00399B6379